MHPNLTRHLQSAQQSLQLARHNSYSNVRAMAFTTARGELIAALAIAKTLALGSVIARVLLALREVGKASKRED